MVNSIEQISRTDNFLGNTGSGSSNASNDVSSKSDVQPESTLNVTSVEVEWERGECAAAAAADTVSLPLPEEDDVESSVSAATTASREDANSIERAQLLPNFYLTYAVPNAERKGKTSAKKLRLEGKASTKLPQNLWSLFTCQSRLSSQTRGRTECRKLLRIVRRSNNPNLNSSFRPRDFIVGPVSNLAETDTSKSALAMCREVDAP